MKVGEHRIAVADAARQSGPRGDDRRNQAGYAKRRDDFEHIAHDDRDAGFFAEHPPGVGSA